jgi:hypothetical protein
MVPGPGLEPWRTAVRTPSSTPANPGSFSWAREELNLSSAGYRPAALPLSYAPVRGAGIEPASSACGAEAQPLDQPRGRRRGSRTRNLLFPKQAAFHQAFAPQSCPVAESDRTLRFFRPALVTSRASGANGRVGFSPPIFASIQFSQSCAGGRRSLSSGISGSNAARRLQRPTSSQRIPIVLVLVSRRGIEPRSPA